MNRVDIILFQLESCDTCDVTWAILQSYRGIMNDMMGEDLISLKRYSLAEDEGAVIAARMGVRTTPTFFINGEKHEGRMTGDKIFESIASRLGLAPERVAELKRSIFG
jgi:glutaredoxin